jgi:hypothetical protein
MAAVAPPQSCDGCGSGSLTRLPMVLADGTDVLFVSCQECEQRRWLVEQEDGWSALPIEAVLQRSTRRR